MDEVAIEKGRVFVKCDNCGKEFKVKPYRLRQDHIFCSKKCYVEWRKGKFFGQRKGRFIPCEVCGKLTYYKPYRIKKNKHFTCSRKCLGKLVWSLYKDKIITPERNEKIRQSKLGNPSLTGRKRPRQSMLIKKKWEKDKEYRKKQEEGRQRFWNSEAGKRRKEELSKLLKGKKRPNHSEKMKEKWLDEKWAEFFMKRCEIKPNRKEIKLNNLLCSLFPNEYKYVGDGQFFLAGKCPDFININGQKKIIELFGDFWHSKEITGRDREKEEQQRINLFAKYGYKTLIIWERELKNLEKVKQKIIDFHNNK